MGIFKLNGIDYMGGGGGGNANERVLTWAEYCALTEEEKTNGTTYYINDINGEGKDQFQPVICSSEEREIGVFSDGKPLYERTFTKTLASTPDADSASFLVASNIDYIDTLVHMWGAVSSTNGTAWSGSTGLILADGWKYSFHINPSNQLVVWTSESITAYREIAGGKVTITIRYTKTSDVAGSGTWTPQGVPAVHYDGDEKVVGTWFNETLYEKTVTFTAPSNNYVTVATNITDFDKCIGYSGIVVFGSGIFEDINYNRPDSNNSTYYTAITATGDVFFRTYEAITGTVYITMQYIKSTS